MTRILRLEVNESKEVAFYQEASAVKTTNQNVPDDLLLGDESKYDEHEKLLLN